VASIAAKLAKKISHGSINIYVNKSIITSACSQISGGAVSINILECNLELKLSNCNYLIFKEIACMKNAAFRCCTCRIWAI